MRQQHPKALDWELLHRLDQKLDYLIHLLREDDLRFPQHEHYLDEHRSTRP